MIYAEGKVVNGNVVLSNKKIVDQSTLTSDCSLIQIMGAKACSSCEYLNKPRKCDGMALREKLGVPAPIVRKRKKA